MGVNLTKGQKIDLTKGKTGISKVIVGLGWDEVKQKKSFFGGKPAEIDCDASAIICGSDSKLSVKQAVVGENKLNADVVYFGNLSHLSGAITHLGDNLTGGGDGDDEQIVVELSRVPDKYEHIFFVVNIYQAVQKKQHFGLIENAFIRIVDATTNTELCKYNLTDNYSGMTAMIFGEMYRHQGEWKFNAIGQGTTDASVVNTVSRYI
jgi:stress response protein SCP2